MINFLLGELDDAWERLWFNRPQRILRLITKCKTIMDLRTVVPNVTTQVRNPNLKRPGTWMPLTKYIETYLPMFANSNVGPLRLLFGELPSMVPDHERFANVYVVHEGAIYDTGVVACVFDGDKNPSLLVRYEVIYSAVDHNVPRSSGDNFCDEILQPGEEPPALARVYAQPLLTRERLRV